MAAALFDSLVLRRTCTQTYTKQTTSASIFLDLMVHCTFRLFPDTLQIKRRDGQLVNTIVMFEVRLPAQL